MQLKNPIVETVTLSVDEVPQFLNQEGKSFAILGIVPGGYMSYDGGASSLQSVVIIYQDMTEIAAMQRAAQEARAAELAKRNNNGSGIVIPELERQRN